MHLMRNLVLQSLNSKRLCSLAAKLFLRSRRWTPTEQVNVVDSFLRSKFIYTEEKIETLVSPDYMLQGLERTGVLRGDCDDISMLNAAILTCMDIKVRFVAIRSEQSNPNYDHVFIEAFNNIIWVDKDLTVPLGTPLEFFSRITVDI